MKFTHSKSRLEGFSDAVFAFAATLLVVSLEIPESFDLLKEQLYGFIPFAISFFALMMIWKLHYNLFRRIVQIDNLFIAFNMIMVFTVLYFVYPLKFLSNLAFGSKSGITFNEFANLFQLYSFGFLLVFLSLVLLYWHSARKAIEESHKKMLYFYARHFGIFVFMSIVSILLAHWKVGLLFGLPGIIYALLGPLCYLHGKKWGYE